MQCPVCNTQTTEENQEYCTTCAWEFEYFVGELEDEEKTKYHRRLEISQNVYEKSILEPKVIYTEKTTENTSEKNDETVEIDGLMYQKQSFVDVYTWDEAMQYAKDLRLGGYDDWRLPTIIELQKLLVSVPNITLNNQEIYIKKEFSINFEEYNWVWTEIEKDLYIAWYINFYTGKFDWNKKVYKNYVLCVR